MNFNNKAERDNAMTMMTMRRLVEKMDWQEIGPDLYENVTPLSQNQVMATLGAAFSLTVPMLVAKLKREGHLTNIAAVHHKDVGTITVPKKQHRLVLAVEDMVALGDVIDFAKIKRPSPAFVAAAARTPVDEEAPELDETKQFLPLHGEAEFNTAVPFEQKLQIA